MTIDTEIAYLTSELTNVREKITKIAHLKSMEEGSSSSRFSTQFTELDKLEKREHKLMVRLNTLQGYN